MRRNVIVFSFAGEERNVRELPQVAWAAKQNVEEVFREFRGTSPGALCPWALFGGSRQRGRKRIAPALKSWASLPKAVALGYGVWHPAILNVFQSTEIRRRVRHHFHAVRAMEPQELFGRASCSHYHSLAGKRPLCLTRVSYHAFWQKIPTPWHGIPLDSG